MDTTPEIASQAVILIENRHSQRDVARLLNMTRSAVRRVYQRYDFIGDQKQAEVGAQLSKMTTLLYQQRYGNILQQLREVRGC